MTVIEFPSTEVALSDALAAVPPPCSIGQLVRVQCPAGRVLINNEIGALFAPGVPTPQTVTPTTLRRLADGDLLLVADDPAEAPAPAPNAPVTAA